MENGLSIEINYWEFLKGILSAMWELWPIWLFFLIIAAFKLAFYWLGLEMKELKKVLRFKKGGKWRSDRDLIKWVRGMDPTEFEEYIAWIFNKLGYKARSVGRSHDGGIDVVAEKDGVEHLIQCKKYFKRHSVSVGEVRDFYGAIADRITEGKAYFITTNKFTLEAEKFAEDKPIELVDSFKLIKYIRLVENKSGESYKKGNNKKSCPECGGKLILRKGKYGEFYGCSNYPKCKYTKNKK